MKLLSAFKFFCVCLYGKQNVNREESLAGKERNSTSDFYIGQKGDYSRWDIDSYPQVASFQSKSVIDYMFAHLTESTPGSWKQRDILRVVLLMVRHVSLKISLKEAHGNHFVQKKIKWGESRRCQPGFRIEVWISTECRHVRRKTLWQLFHLKEIYCAESEEREKKKSLVVVGRREKHLHLAFTDQ